MTRIIKFSPNTDNIQCDQICPWHIGKTSRVFCVAVNNVTVQEFLNIIRGVTRGAVSGANQTSICQCNIKYLCLNNRAVYKIYD